MKPLFGLITCLLILFSCEENPKDKGNKISRDIELKTIKVNLSETKEISLSALYDSIDVISLETTSQNVLDRIIKLEIHNNKFYLQTPTVIAIYSLEGKFINSINMEGRGPGEYISLSDFYVNDDGSIEIYDSKAKKIIKYSEDGNYIHEFNTSLDGYSFTKISDSLYAVYIGSGNYNIVSNFQLNIINERGEILKKYKKIEPNQAKFMHLGDLRNFQKMQSGTSFLYSFNDTIYKLNNKGEVFQDYYVDFGSDKLPDEYLTKEYGNIMEFLEPLKKTTYAYRIIGFIQGDNAIAFGFMNEGKIPHVYYSHKDKKTYVANSINYDLLLPGMVVEASIENLPIAINNNKWYTILNANTFIENVDSLRSSMNDEQWKQYSQNNKRIISIYEGIDIQDNPLILVGKIKI